MLDYTTEWNSEYHNKNFMSYLLKEVLWRNNDFNEYMEFEVRNLLFALILKMFKCVEKLLVVNIYNLWVIYHKVLFSNANTFYNSWFLNDENLHYKMVFFVTLEGRSHVWGGEVENVIFSWTSFIKGPLQTC